MKGGIHSGRRLESGGGRGWTNTSPLRQCDEEAAAYCMELMLAAGLESTGVVEPQWFNLSRSLTGHLLSAQSRVWLKMRRLYSRIGSFHLLAMLLLPPCLPVCAPASLPCCLCLLLPWPLPAPLLPGCKVVIMGEWHLEHGRVTGGVD